MRIKRHTIELVDFILDIVYPPKCIFCKKIVDNIEPFICSDCSASLQLVSSSEARHDIQDCNACYSSLVYEGNVQTSIQAFKFYGKASNHRTYAKLIYETVKNCGIIFDLITWVPISKKRKKTRGYDQSALIAKRLSFLLDIKYSMLLNKCRDNPAQSSTKSADERRSNVKGAYEVVPNADIKGKTILIIDDVVTTGSTLSECCSMLKNAGASCVYAATVAKSKYSEVI